MEPAPDRIKQLATLFFQHAIMLLVEGEVYIQHQHLLELIPLEHQVAFLELLGAGTGLRDCFGELDTFLVWQETMLPLLVEQDIFLPLTSQQIAMYILDKQLEPGWHSVGLTRPVEF